LTRVADVDIRNAADAFERMMGTQGSVAVTVLRDGAERTVDFVPGTMGAPADRVFRVEGSQVQVFRSE
jgi:hypothetical protein